MIAVDVMGGDRAPDIVGQGAVRASKRVPVLLVGPERETRELLHQIDPGWEACNITLWDAPQNSSLVKAVFCVKEGKDFAALSAGNSGALMVAATFILGREENLDRPAVAGYFPPIDGSA